MDLDWFLLGVFLCQVFFSIRTSLFHPPAPSSSAADVFMLFAYGARCMGMNKQVSVWSAGRLPRDLQ